MDPGQRSSHQAHPALPSGFLITCREEGDSTQSWEGNSLHGRLASCAQRRGGLIWSKSVLIKLESAF